MAAVNVYEAKTHFSLLLRRVRAGEEIVIADNGQPVAMLVPFRTAEGTRELGGDEELVTIADDFDAPLPDDILAGFHALHASTREVATDPTANRPPRKPTAPIPKRTGSPKARKHR